MAATQAEHAAALPYATLYLKYSSDTGGKWKTTSKIWKGLLQFIRFSFMKYCCRDAGPLKKNKLQSSGSILKEFCCSITICSEPPEGPPDYESTWYMFITLSTLSTLSPPYYNISRTFGSRVRLHPMGNLRLEACTGWRFGQWRDKAVVMQGCGRCQGPHVPSKQEQQHQGSPSSISITSVGRWEASGLDCWPEWIGPEVIAASALPWRHNL